MLSKITDIQTGNGFESQNHKPDGFSRAYRRDSSNLKEFHDSVEFSPAMLYLNQVKWRLKKLNKDNEVLGLAVLIADYEFQTTIDLENINSLQRIYYKVVKPIEDYKNIKSVYGAFLLNNLKRMKLPESEVGLKALDKIFNRFLEREELKNISNWEENIIFENILNNIEEELTKEFEAVTEVLFSFVEKFTGKSVGIMQFNQEPSSNRLLIIELNKQLK